MSFNRFSASVIVSIGLGWGLLSGLIAANSSYLYQWERVAHDTVMGLRRSPQVPPEILLVKLQVDPQDFSHPLLRQEFDQQSEPPLSLDAEALRALQQDVATLQTPADFQREYFGPIVAQLVPAMLEQGNARLVILNTPHQWPPDQDIQTNAASDIARMVETYHQRLVFVNGIQHPPDAWPAPLNNYNAVLPFDDQDLRPKLSPQSIQAFWEQLPTRQIWRTTLLARQFAAGTDSPQVFASLALLADRKLKGKRDGLNVSELPQWMFQPVWVPVGPAGSFASRHLKLATGCPTQICSAETIQTMGDLTGKVVLIELEVLEPTTGTSHIAGEVRTAQGLMSRQEVQANALASLLQASFAQEVIRIQPLLTYGVIVAMALGLTLVILRGVDRGNRRGIWRLWLGGLLGYFGVYLWCGWQGLLLPLLLPLFTWLGTGVATTVYALLWQQHQQVTQTIIEEEALVLKTKLLLRRIAADVHGGPLQELRAAMFAVEQLQRQEPQLEVTPILDVLVHIGQDVRQQLSDVQAMATKLRVTPQLRGGLDAGIRLHLQQMCAVGRLQVQVCPALQRLAEPKFNTAWIAAREDIFRFFCEAINNVVAHAQPPYGNASQVTVRLSQTGQACRLAIANNGSLQPLPSERPTGQGTKAMAEIAQDLPDGRWQQAPLPAGGFGVELHWSMQFPLV